MHTIHHAIAELVRQQPLPQNLTAPYRGLEIVEYTTRGLVFLDPIDASSRWREPQRLAARARGELARAPSIRWPLDLPPPVLALGNEDHEDVATSLAELVDALVLTLTETASEATDHGDRVACLAAATHACDLQRALSTPT